jgi:hypothetical protein
MQEQNYQQIDIDLPKGSIAKLMPDIAYKEKLARDVDLLDVAELEK